MASQVVQYLRICLPLQENQDFLLKEKYIGLKSKGLSKSIILNKNTI